MHIPHPCARYMTWKKDLGLFSFLLCNNKFTTSQSSIATPKAFENSNSTKYSHIDKYKQDTHSSMITWDILKQVNILCCARRDFPKGRNLTFIKCLADCCQNSTDIHAALKLKLSTKFNTSCLSKGKAVYCSCLQILKKKEFELKLAVLKV